MATSSVTWADENRVAELVRLYEAGKSCAVIAAEMGGGITRNAVIGKVHRLKLEKRGGSKGVFRGNGKPRAARAPRKRTAKFMLYAPTIKPLPFICAEVPEVAPLHLSFADLGAGDCRWPFGTSTPYTFCGHPKIVRCYCAAHHLLSIGNGTASERRATHIQPESKHQVYFV
jgi:GcrA cell cycle regulator